MKFSEFLLLALAGLTIGALGNAADDSKELRRQQDEYCNMVQVFKETNGQYGWPDYRGNAAEVCK